MGKLAKPSPSPLADISPEDLPSIDNEPSLQEWIEAQGAEPVWRLNGGAVAGVPQFELTLWRFPNGRTAIVQIASHGRGWEIYPALGASDIDDALTAAEEALGLEPKD